jgi:hypothetical protein
LGFGWAQGWDRVRIYYRPGSDGTTQALQGLNLRIVEFGEAIAIAPDIALRAHASSAARVAGRTDLRNIPSTISGYKRWNGSPRSIRTSKILW